MVDDDREVRELLTEFLHVWHSRRGSENRHGNLEILATLPQRRHQRAADPIAGGISTWRNANTPEPLLLYELRKMIRRGRVLGIDARHTVEVLRVALKHVGEITIVPAIVNHLDNDSFGDSMLVHQIEQHLSSCVLGRRIPRL